MKKPDRLLRDLNFYFEKNSPSSLSSRSFSEERLGPGSGLSLPLFSVGRSFSAALVGLLIVSLINEVPFELVCVGGEGKEGQMDRVAELIRSTRTKSESIDTFKITHLIQCVSFCVRYETRGSR